MLNASFQFPLRGGVGNLPDTHGINTVNKKRPIYSLSINLCDMALNAVNETKAYPTIQHPNNNANRGLPTSERPIGLCVMPKGEKSRNGDVREMTLNIRHGNGVPIVVRGR